MIFHEKKKVCLHCHCLTCWRIEIISLSRPRSQQKEQRGAKQSDGQEEHGPAQLAKLHDHAFIVSLKEFVINVITSQLTSKMTELTTQRS